MKVLLDTNVVLDVLLQRGEWAAAAQAVWDASDAGRLESCVSASSLTDIYYITRRLVGRREARKALRICMDNLTLLTISADVLEQAWSFGHEDFEDAVQIAAAAKHGLDAIVTRDASDFAGSPIAVVSPLELAAQLASTT